MESNPGSNLSKNPFRMRHFKSSKKSNALALAESAHPGQITFKRSESETEPLSQSLSDSEPS